MKATRKSEILRIIPLLLAVCLVGMPTYAKYGGGSGTAEDPYQIATAADLIALGESPQDYDKQFVLTADIDLDPYLPVRKVFHRALISSFSGVFDGDGHTISHLTMTGENYRALFGYLESSAKVRNLGLVDVNITASGWYVGALVGYSFVLVTRCYATCVVSGGEYSIGGLLGCPGCDGSAFRRR